MKTFASPGRGSSYSDTNHLPLPPPSRLTRAWACRGLAPNGGACHKMSIFQLVTPGFTMSIFVSLRKNTSERGTIRELRRVFKTVALLPKGHTTGRGQKPKRSPKGRSASPGTRPGVASSGRPRGGGQIDLGGPKRRDGSGRHGQQRAEGTNLGCDRGWSSYAPARGLTNRHTGLAEDLKQSRHRQGCCDTRARRA